MVWSSRLESIGISPEFILQTIAALQLESLFSLIITTIFIKFLNEDQDTITLPLVGPIKITPIRISILKTIIVIFTIWWITPKFVENTSMSSSIDNI